MTAPPDLWLLLCAGLVLLILGRFRRRDWRATEAP
jgi:MYXO-CTERM domain-containing protein